MEGLWAGHSKRAASAAGSASGLAELEIIGGFIKDEYYS
jgi:hypothetical protein